MSKVSERVPLAGPVVLAAVLCVGLGDAAATTVEDQTTAVKENASLKRELELAKSSSLYFIFDLGKKSIHLKSRGVLLREWQLEKVERWGDLRISGPVTLGKKSSLFQPKRKKIKPGAEEETGSFELDALELKDMPSSYVFHLDGGIRIYVRPRAEGFISRLASVGGFFAWNLWVPLKNLAAELRKRPFGAINLCLTNRDDARSLYWSLYEGIRGILVLN